MERPRWRFTAHYRLHHRLQLGAEINPAAEEIGPLFSLFLFTESETRPALFVGTSSDRIGSPKGKQSYFLTASKFVHVAPLSVYASLNYSEWDSGFNFPFGANLEFGGGVSSRYMFDGDRSHLLLNYFAERFGVSLMYVWLEQFGLSLSFGF